MSRVVIKTLGWTGDGPADLERPAESMLHGRVFIDGVELRDASAAKISFEGGGWGEIWIRLNGTAAVEVLTRDAWDALP